jgi:predicted transcriptional regulator
MAEINPEEIGGGGRRRQLSAFRRDLAVEVVQTYGLPLADAARLLGISPSGIAKILRRFAEK